jgi:integrase
LQTQTLNIRQGGWRGKVQTVKNTASENTLPIPAVLDGWFHEYLKMWKPNPLGLLFCNRNRRAYTLQKVAEYHLWPLLDALKIKRARFHAFRHAHTTLLLEGGASPKVAQRQLRHADARLTFGHLCSSRRGNAP